MANALIHDVLEHDVDFTSMGFIAFEGIKEGQEVSYWHVIHLLQHPVRIEAAISHLCLILLPTNYQCNVAPSDQLSV